MYSFFTIPSATTVVTSSTDYASTLTTEFLPLVWVVLGVTAAVVLVRFIIKLVRGGLRGATGMGRGRGRLRRR